MTSTGGPSTSMSGVCGGKTSLMNVSGSLKSTSSTTTPGLSTTAMMRHNTAVSKSAGTSSGGPPPAPSSGAAAAFATTPTSAASLRLYRSRSNTDSDLQNNIIPFQSHHYTSGIRRPLFSVGGFLAPSVTQSSAIPSVSTTTTTGIHQVQSGVNADSMHSQSSPFLQQQGANQEACSTLLPSNTRRRLYELFGLIEKEFEALHAENFALRAKVEALTERLTEGGTLAPEKAAEILEITAGDVLGTTIGKPGSTKKGSHVGQKLKTALRVVPAPGRNLVSSFKANVQLGGGGGDASRIRFVHPFLGHRDGIWDAAVASPPNVSSGYPKTSIVGSASADQTVRIWSIETGALLLVYTGHTGSVNDISFHNASSSDYLTAVTASGDQSAHIWKVTLPNLPTQMASIQPHSSEDELEQSSLAERSAILEESAGDEGESHSYATVRSPLMQLTGHTSAVIAVDWLYGGDQVITASWDRTANIYDVERGEILNVLTGHDQELNHCCAHSSRKLVVTSSKDTTFRLWDFRDPIYSVAVFQGHNEAVSSAVFSSGDKVVSGSDDRTVKVWDLKNMRTALATIRTDSAVNRLALSQQHNIIAIPHDNRNVRLYDLNGNRLGRLPRSSRRGHRRMVCAAVWADDNPHCNLFTCGFDKQLLGWKVATSFGKGDKD